MRFDLVDEANLQSIKSEMHSILSAVDNNVAIAVLRDLMIDEISRIVEKFPEQIQREIIALLAHKYLSRWAT